MLGVAMKGGTARRAAVGGYSVAGKTSTTKVGYSSVNYNASFIGIVPAHDPVFVVLVSYQHPEYCSSFQYHEQTGLPLSNHQGGVCAASVFSHVAAAIAPCLGVEPDPAKAMDWNMRAAEQGNAQGQEQIGKMYYLGVGVTKSAEEASRWFERARDAGSEWAAAMLEQPDVAAAADYHSAHA